ncbi:MAG: helix-turn-helix domain-containing protein [Gemmatimonadetes bacterium]|nr:helix-turn-helix domain-containing protein [Gemmatimonadota bacterium]
MEGLGAYLKRGRTEAGLSLEDLAGRTRIRIENLQRLEAEEIDALPTDTYVRGFVRLVCQELGLSSGEALERYESLRTHQETTDEIVWEAESHTEEPTRLERALKDPERVVGIARKAGIGLGVAIVLALALVIGRWVTGRGDGAAVDVARTEPAPAEQAKAPERAAVTEGAGTTESAKPAEPVKGADSSPTTSRRVSPDLLAQPEVSPVLPADRHAAEQAARVAVASETAIHEEAEIPTAGTTAGHRNGGNGVGTAAAAELTPPPVPARMAETPPMLLELAQVDVAPPTAGLQPGPPSRRAADPIEGEDLSTGTVAADEMEQVAPSVRTDSEVAAPREKTPAKTPAPAVDDAPARREIVGRSAVSDRVEMTLVATRDVDVTVLIDGVGWPRNKHLAPGERMTWKANQSFRVSAADAGAFRVIFEGDDLGPAGATGESVDGLVVRAR